MAGWSDTKTIGFKKKPYLFQEIEIYDFPVREWVQIRLFGPITTFMQGWINTRNKEKDKINKFPKNCLDYSRKKHDIVREICPYRKNGVYMPQRFLTNFIVRDLVGEGKARTPAKSELKPREMLGEKFYIKDPKSKTPTPVRAKDFPSGFRDAVKQNTDLYNKTLIAKKIIKKTHPTVELNDPDLGTDILVMFDPDKKGPAMWSVQLEDKRPKPLKPSEKKYLIYDIENLESLVPESKEEAEAEWKKIKQNIILKDKDGKLIKFDKDKDEDDDDDDTDLEETKPKKKKLKSKLKSKVKKKSSSTPPWEDEDEVKPKKKKLKTKTPSKVKTKKTSSSKLSAKKKKAKAKQFDDLDDLD